MRARTCVITCCALVLLGALTAATAAATPLDKCTTFTFSAPFSIPGVTLPAGSYVFRLADDLSDDGRSNEARPACDEENHACCLMRCVA